MKTRLALHKYGGVRETDTHTHTQRERERERQRERERKREGRVIDESVCDMKRRGW